ncbi:DsbA family protein [Micromonospora tulbaghiae]|uniref:2-hydroxychromene-2-carboxylate isomerase n=1 Tax=Micromonospora tulbaghiae TaxID=479978 RepID=A0AAW4JIK2_9ACTN|nr:MULTISPECIES: DsbA family protein [Micromonospora]KAB1910133.1 disulfide bond formation protein DsbA [Micromonospora sp. AMSO1212t]MBO4138571.1 DsbA family protein [Micromonospora tulbaghiae]MDX5458388.1 DsbA family protein [Micromonospora tulbaghiae]SCE74315.1 2-hydroxychromene-2-carboxylate isomerase [Micromonospora tulbaghiae]
MTDRPRVYFSFQSPFSWMALRQLEERVPDFADRFEYVPFWDPDTRMRAALADRGADFHYTVMSKAKHLYILHDTKRLAAGLGYRLVWPVDVAPWWEPSALGWLRARELGCERRFYRVVTEARWHRGDNISDPQTLRAACDAAGLPGAELMAAADDDRIRELGLDALVRAHRDEVFGIPLFIVGRHRFWGVDRVAEVESAVRARSAAQPGGAADPSDRLPVAALATIGSFDHDEPGGCG